MYQLAVGLIESGKAYVDSLDEEQIREYRGSLTEPGRPSPHRERTVAENLDLFRRMRAGEFPDGAHVLRGRLDMAAANMKIRDPLLYRSAHAHHHRTATPGALPDVRLRAPLSDAIEDISHSICTLEFENNRELYDGSSPPPASPRSQAPHQFEFRPPHIDYTVMSKRKLLELVTGKVVSGWDDPRMPTIAACAAAATARGAARLLRHDRRGQDNSLVDLGKLEFCVRDDLGAPRRARWRCCGRQGHAYQRGGRRARGRDRGRPRLPSRTSLAIEREDFQLEPEAAICAWRPSEGGCVTVACITCDEAVRDDASGRSSSSSAACCPNARRRQSAGDTKVWGVIHWVAIAEAVTARCDLYVPHVRGAAPRRGARLRLARQPEVAGAADRLLLEPALAGAEPGSRYQSSARACSRR